VAPGLLEPLTFFKVPSVIALEGQMKEKREIDEKQLNSLKTLLERYKAKITEISPKTWEAEFPNGEYLFDFFEVFDDFGSGFGNISTSLRFLPGEEKLWYIEPNDTEPPSLATIRKIRNPVLIIATGN